MNGNICRFVPVNPASDHIHILNFVLETQPANMDKIRVLASYRLHYVCSGSGVLCCGGMSYPVKKGDLFFLLPAVPFSFEASHDFTYMYISFLGVRANQILETLKIQAKNCVFDGYEQLEGFWRNGLTYSEEMVGLISESVLLYTLAELGKRTICDSTDEKKMAAAPIVLRVKKYIDDNFSDPQICLEKISTEFSYNKKYLSTAFKQHLKTGVVDYLNTVRIQHACALMEQNYTSIQDIALLCGFSDPMYFSRVFKQKMGVSPKKHLQLRNEEA